jgi:hypothetical protein
MSGTRRNGKVTRSPKLQESLDRQVPGRMPTASRTGSRVSYKRLPARSLGWHEPCSSKGIPKSPVLTGSPSGSPVYRGSSDSTSGLALGGQRE